MIEDGSTDAPQGDATTRAEGGWEPFGGVLGLTVCDKLTTRMDRNGTRDMMVATRGGQKPSCGND